MYWVVYGLVLLSIYLANRADVDRTLQPAVYVLLGLGDLVVCLVGLLAVVLGALLATADPEVAAMAIGGGGVLVLTSILAGLTLIPGVRRWLARTLNIDPESSVHLTALSMAVYAVGSGVLQLLMWQEISDSLPETVALTPADLAITSVSMLLMAFVGVGLLVRRTPGETLTRLGIRKPTWRNLLLVIALIGGFLIMDLVTGWAWERVAPLSYESAQETSNALFGSLMTPMGALAIGVAAGVGEEILFRGALQPRFGLVPTAMLFALAHFQYAFTPGMLEVLAIGLVLGWMRRRIGTLPCILLHAGYNAANMALMMLGVA